MTLPPDSEGKKQFTLLARTEWVLFVAANFPVTLLMPLLLLFSPRPLLIFVGLFYSVIQTVCIFLTSVVFAMFFDGARKLFSVKGKPIQQGAVDALKQVLSDDAPPALLSILSNSYVVMKDLSIGAQVRGVIQPRIVLSGGMLVGLLRRDPSAICVLLHEYAHIQHFDRILPGVIAFAVFDLMARPITLFMTQDTRLWPAIFLALYQLVVFGVTISFVSKYREYYADAKVIQLSRNRESYLAMLQGATEGAKRALNFFHPSPQQRIAEAELGHRVLVWSIFWKVYWALNITVSWIQIKFSGDSDDIIIYAYCMVIISVICLVFEACRKPLLFASAGFISSAGSFLTMIRPGHRFARLSFLLGGFLLVSYVATNFGGSNEGIMMAVGGGIVYAIWQSMKK